MFRDIRFGSTYEGLKLPRRPRPRSAASGFGSTYEGLKPVLKEAIATIDDVLAVPMRA